MEGESRPSDSRAARRALAVAAFLLCAATIWIGGEFAGTVLFSSWMVTTFFPLQIRLERRMSKNAAALLMTTGILMVVIIPLSLLGVILVSQTTELVGQVVTLWQSGNLRDIAGSILRDQGGAPPTMKLSDLYREAARIAPSVLVGVGRVFAFFSDAVVRFFLFVLFLYGLFAHGRAAKAWIAKGSPFGPRNTDAFMGVFAQTGQGILVGVFGVIVLHGIVASLGYSLIGIGRPLELGTLTAFAGLVPAIGTGLVWGPLAIVLFVNGHTTHGILVLVVGFVVSSVDNLLRPWLSKLGAVPLPTLALFLSFFSGIATLGPSGLLIAPLVFAWTKRAIDLYGEQKAARVRT